MQYSNSFFFRKLTFILVLIFICYSCGKEENSEISDLSHGVNKINLRDLNTNELLSSQTAFVTPNKETLSDILDLMS